MLIALDSTEEMEVSFNEQVLRTRHGQAIRDNWSAASQQQSPTHTHSSFWHWGGMQPLTAPTHLSAQWAAKYNVSFQRRRSDERSQVNCLGYNRNLPVRLSHFPWQLGLTSPQVLVNKPWGWHSCDWVLLWRPDSTCHLLAVYRAWTICDEQYLNSTEREANILN